jgi:D-alanyl-D-alanine carboxypeptidase
MLTRRNALQATGVAALAAATGMVAAPARAETGSPEFDIAALQSALDGIASTAASAVLAEVRDGRCVWTGTSGVARLGTDQPVPAGGQFRAGSITKPFVATVILQLAGERRLGLDDTLQRHLPGLLPDGARITLRHLLQHTSGVPDYTRTAAFGAFYGTAADIVRMRDRTWTTQELLSLVHDIPLGFEPGTDLFYSNTNYLLLAMVVERLTGRDYRTEIQRRILRPLGMRRTRAPGTDPFLTGPHPHAYLPVDGTPVDITVFNPSVSGAAGEIVSTAADLNDFFRALLGGRLLRPAEQRQLLTSRPTQAGYDYGLGLMSLKLADGSRVWGHRGETFGYYAESWTAENDGRQLTVAATPWGTGKPKALIAALVQTVFAGAGPAQR